MVSNSIFFGGGGGRLLCQRAKILYHVVMDVNVRRRGIFIKVETRPRMSHLKLLTCFLALHSTCQFSLVFGVFGQGFQISPFKTQKVHVFSVP